MIDRLRNIKTAITDWESWPFKLIYAPLVPFWCWYMLRSHSVWFFTPSNPKLTFGGMEGEPKKELFELLPTHLYPVCFNVSNEKSLDWIKYEIEKHKIEYPLIVKPEIGGQGILFRKIDTEDQLKNYHQKISVEYIVQEMVNYPMEVSVFYMRHPTSQTGIVSGFLHKIPMYITGNGKSTIEELISIHPKATKKEERLKIKFLKNLGEILPKGEVFKLSYAANHNQGARFIDLKNKIDDGLVKIFDEISFSINDFFYGRYDILCNSIEELKEGKNFKILEYNGCGAEPNHFYDNGYSLLQAYKEILWHWKYLFKISKYNAKHAVKPWSFKKGFLFRQETIKLFKKMRRLDMEIE